MPPNMVALVMVAIAGMIAITITQVVKAIAGRGASPSELAHIKQQLEQHVAALEEAQATLADQSQQIAELQERADFAERLLAQGRDRAAMGPGQKRE